MLLFCGGTNGIAAPKPRDYDSTLFDLEAEFEFRFGADQRELKPA
jgi:hypothetical protein